MISEIDIRDWEKIDIEKMRTSLYHIAPSWDGKDFNFLCEMINHIDNLKREYMPQIPALFKEPNVKMCRED